MGFFGSGFMASELAMFSGSRYVSLAGPLTLQKMPFFSFSCLSISVQFHFLMIAIIACPSTPPFSFEMSFIDFVHMCMQGVRWATVFMWRSEDNLQ